MVQWTAEHRSRWLGRSRSIPRWCLCTWWRLIGTRSCRKEWWPSRCNRQWCCCYCEEQRCTSAGSTQVSIENGRSHSRSTSQTTITCLCAGSGTDEQRTTSRPIFPRAILRADEGSHKALHRLTTINCLRQKTHGRFCIACIAGRYADSHIGSPQTAHHTRL